MKETFLKIPVAEVPCLETRGVEFKTDVLNANAQRGRRGQGGVPKALIAREMSGREGRAWFGARWDGGEAHHDRNASSPPLP